MTQRPYWCFPKFCPIRGLGAGLRSGAKVLRQHIAGSLTLTLTSILLATACGLERDCLLKFEIFAEYQACQHTLRLMRLDNT